MHIDNDIVFTHEQEKVMFFAGKQLQLERIILSELSLSQKHKYTFCTFGVSDYSFINSCAYLRHEIIFHSTMTARLKIQ